MTEEKKMTLREEFERIIENIRKGEYRDSTHYFFTEIQQVVYKSLGLNLMLTPNAEVTKRPPRVDLLYTPWGDSARKKKNHFLTESPKAKRIMLRWN